MNKIIIAAMTLLSTAVCGQHQIGINGGITLSTFSGIDYDYQPGAFYNVEYGCKLSNRISLSTGVEYEQKGAANESIWIDQHGDRYTGTNEYSLDYLSIPVKAGIQFGDQFFGSVNMGLIGRYLINERYYWRSNNTDKDISFGYDLSTVNQTRSFDLSALIELKGGFTFGEQHKIILTTRFDQSIPSFVTNDNPNIVKFRNRGFVLSLGYTYSI